MGIKANPATQTDHTVMVLRSIVTMTLEFRVQALGLDSCSPPFEDYSRIFAGLAPDTFCGKFSSRIFANVHIQHMIPTTFDIVHVSDTTPKFVFVHAFEVTQPLYTKFTDLPFVTSLSAIDVS